MKRTLLLSLLCPALSFAALICSSPCHQNQGYALDEHAFLPGYTPSARFATHHPWNLNLQGSYLFLKPYEAGLDVAKESSNITKPFYIDPQYKSSYKAALGLFFSPDDWLVSLEYFHFNKISSRVLHEEKENSLFPIWFGNTLTHPSLSRASADWKLHLDTIDGLLSRSGYTGKSFILTIASGLKLGSIEQSFKPTYTFFTSKNQATSHNRSKSWLLGPEVGFLNKAFIGDHFHLFCNLFSSLTYQKYHLKCKEQDPENPSQLALNTHFKDSKITPIFILSSGVGFDIFAPKESFHFTATVGYEFQSYFRQNLMRELVETVKNQLAQDAQNLYLHGIVAQGTFDF